MYSYTMTINLPCGESSSHGYPIRDGQLVDSHTDSSTLGRTNIDASPSISTVSNTNSPAITTTNNNTMNTSGPTLSNTTNVTNVVSTSGTAATINNSENTSSTKIIFPKGRRIWLKPDFVRKMKENIQQRKPIYFEVNHDKFLNYLKFNILIISNIVSS